RLRHAYDISPHYRTVFDTVGPLPADITGLDDLPTLPFTPRLTCGPGPRSACLPCPASPSPASTPPPGPPGSRSRSATPPRRLRQDDHPAHGRPAGRADRGQDPAGRARRGAGPPGGVAAGHRLRDPADRAVPAPDGRGQHRHGPAAERLAPGEGPRSGPGADGAGRPGCRFGTPLPAAA